MASCLGGLAALALVIGMRSPAVAQVPDPTGKAEQTADPLLNLNNASRMFYTLAKQQTLAKSGPVMIVIGDDLVLRKGEKRTQARVIPEIYHTLKTFDHIRPAPRRRARRPTLTRTPLERGFPERPCAIIAASSRPPESASTRPGSTPNNVRGRRRSSPRVPSSSTRSSTSGNAYRPSASRSPVR